MEQNIFWMNLASRLHFLFVIGFLNHYTSFTKLQLQIKSIISILHQVAVLDELLMRLLSA
jgi:hypothetical protein